jgi:hypothetical protein
VYNIPTITKGINMPNWVYNGLTIEGSPELVNDLVKQMNKPFVMLHDSWNATTGNMEVSQTTYPNPVFAFYNIYNHRQDNITDLEYVAQPVRSKLDTSDKDWWEDTQKLAETDKSWYNWNIRNWGTKWDVAIHENKEYSDTYIEGPTENGENLVVYYNFHTAWSPPVPALAKLSAQYPSLLLTLSYEEETGWGGEMELLRGEVISISEYENKCRDCDSIDTLDYCDNDCGEICSSCNYMGEADLECVAECQTHKIYLDESHVPEYRKEALENATRSI